MPFNFNPFTGKLDITNTGTVTGTGSTGTLPYWTSASDLNYAPDHTMSVVLGRSYMSMAVWSGNPPLTFSNATGYTAMSQSDGFTTGWSIGQGSSGFLNLNGTGGQGVILDGSGTGYFKTSLQLGDPTTTVTDTDFIIGVSSNTNLGLVVQTKAGTTKPAFEIQDSAGVAKTRFDTTGNSAMRINYSGTMAAASYAGFVLSVQNINDAGEGSWIEILNSGGANRGAFFGMIGNQFQQFNWQGGDIEFWTGSGGAAPGANYSRFTITSAGNFGFASNPEYVWGHGWGGGVGVLGIANATTAPTTSLTTALGLYSVSQELWYMSASNQARKVVASTASLTSGRVPIVTTGGLLTDDADLTFATDTLSATKVKMSSLTSGRVPYVSTAGLLIDSSALTYSGTGLTINGAFFSGDGGGFTGLYIGNDGSIADNNDQMWIGDDGSGNAVICADTSLRRVGMGTVSPSGLYGRLHIGAVDNSEIIFRLEGAGGGGGNPTENTHLSKGTTTNATATTIGTYSVSNGYCFQFDTRVVGHRTGGSAGAANDSASYWLRSTFKYTGGAIVQIGTTDKLAHEDQAGWDANWVISGNDLLLQVTGATNNDVAWSSISRVMILNT